MSRLTTEERRRVYLAQEKTRQTMLIQLSAEPAPRPQAGRFDQRGIRRILKTAVVVTLLSGGWLALHALEFHPPTSIVEALLPRL